MVKEDYIHAIFMILPLIAYNLSAMSFEGTMILFAFILTYAALSILKALNKLLHQVERKKEE